MMSLYQWLALNPSPQNPVKVINKVSTDKPYILQVVKTAEEITITTADYATVLNAAKRRHGIR